MEIKVDLKENGYSVLVECGSLQKASENLNLNRKVFIVTDTGVPREYAEDIANQSKEVFIFTIEQGEQSKCFKVLEGILEKMLSVSLSREDCVCAVGGGVVGDLAGFAAACYMRGIDFYNIPTTLLSQLDSSVGGKTAIDFNGVKNIIGAFHQPKKVIIDPNVLKTLDKRQFSNGLAEAIKMALTSDKELFDIVENEDIHENINRIIEKSVSIKADIVSSDEKETGLRRILNFGHTIGHGIESVTPLYHGECVGLGILPMCSDSVKERVIPVLKKAGLPTSCTFDLEKAYSKILHDKKASSGEVNIIRVEKIGEVIQEKVNIETVKRLMEEEFLK